MAPILSGGESDVILVDSKYVRVGKKVAFSNTLDDTRATLIRKYFPHTPKGLDNRPIVADGGTIGTCGGKIYFAGSQPSECKIEGDVEKARQITREVAQRVLGAERVG